MQTLVYISVVYPDQPTGDSSFESGLIDSLNRMVGKDENKRLVLFAAVPPDYQTPDDGDRESSEGIEHTKLVLDKRSYLGFISHQLRLQKRLFQILWKVFL